MWQEFNLRETLHNPTVFQSEFMVEKTGYGLNDLTDVIRDLHLMFQKASSHPQQAVQEKYKAGR